MENVTRKRLSDVEIGKRLEKCRKNRGLTQTQLCELIYGLPDNNGKERSEKQIGYIENGKRPLSLEYANLLSQVLAVRYEYLMGWDDYETEEDCSVAALSKKLNEISKKGAEWRKRYCSVREILEILHYYAEDTHLGFSEDEVKQEYENRKVSAAYDLIMSKKESVIRYIAEQYLSESCKLLEEGYKTAYDREYGTGEYDRVVLLKQKNAEVSELKKLSMLISPEWWIAREERKQKEYEELIQETALNLYDADFKLAQAFTPEETENFINQLYDIVTALIQYHITKKKGQA